MIRRTVPVMAEWAVYGKRPGDRTGFRLLGCSAGTIGRRNLEEALDRFSPGTLTSLPQVSVSYLAPGQDTFLALAIHADGQGDADGRPITLTSHFCVPYQELAAAAIGYQAMYQAFRAVELPLGDGEPVPVKLEMAKPAVPSADDLALRASALLLTGQKVCVLGADRTTVADRLRFVDQVMTLLPYGMRGRMSASTWTRATFTGHRFRLFFSDAPRAADEPDHLLYWGQPDRTPIPSGALYAADYLEWLQNRVAMPAAKLAELTEVSGFGQKRALQLLERIGFSAADPDPPAGDHSDNMHPERFQLRGNESFAADLLRGCVKKIAAQDWRNLRVDINGLANYADSRAVDARWLHRDNPERKRLREIIWRNGLLSPTLPLGRERTRFYDMLLPLAYGVPLSYESYCGLEHDLGTGNPPDRLHRGLLEAIMRTQPSDPRTAIVVCRQLGPKELTAWYKSAAVTAPMLVELIAGPWERPDHARIPCETLRHYLHVMDGKYDRGELRSALRAHGYLASALAGQPQQFQLDVLHDCLRASYGDNGLDNQAVTEIMMGAESRRPPTLGLLAAVLLRLPGGSSADLAAQAMDEYVSAQLLFADFSETANEYLQPFCAAYAPTAPRPALQARRAPGEAEPPRHQQPDQPKPGHRRPPTWVPGLPSWKGRYGGAAYLRDRGR